MTKITKLLARMLTKPTDFSWDELTKVLSSFGYEQISGGKTGGSRIRFIHETNPPIMMHRPHPKPILKRYQLEEIIAHLKRENLI